MKAPDNVNDQLRNLLPLFFDDALNGDKDKACELLTLMNDSESRFAMVGVILHDCLSESVVQNHFPAYRKYDQGSHATMIASLLRDRLLSVVYGNRGGFDQDNVGKLCEEALKHLRKGGESFHPGVAMAGSKVTSSHRGFSTYILRANNLLKERGVRLRKKGELVIVDYIRGEK